MYGLSSVLKPVALFDVHCCLNQAQHQHWQGAVSHYCAVYVWLVSFGTCDAALWLTGCCRADGGCVAAGFELV